MAKGFTAFAFAAVLALVALSGAQARGSLADDTAVVQVMPLR